MCELTAMATVFYAGENEDVEWIDEQHADVTHTPVPEDDASASRSGLPTVTEDDMEGPWED